MYQTEGSRTDLWHTDMEVLSDSTVMGALIVLRFPTPITVERE